ncbi:MAG: MFS transporter [Nitrospiraceae bacterium]
MPPTSTTLPEPTASDPAPVSRVRWRILALLFAISVVTYMDRVNISVTARHMMPAYGLTEQEFGYVFSAFVVGYALCQIPGGWLGDRFGARRVLIWALIWWSIWTALTAVAATSVLASVFGILGSLMVARAMLGVGESTALPNFNRAVADWLPQREQSLGIGLAIGGIGLGAAITPPLTAWLMVNYGWQTAFYAAALVGLVVAAAWAWYATDHPRTHPHISPAELACIEEGKSPQATAPIPWRAIIGSSTVRWLVLSYSCLGYVAYIYMSWFYLYIVNVRGFSELRGAGFTAAPFLAMLIGCPLGGWLTDRLTQSRGITPARRLIGTSGMLASGLAIAGGAWAPHPLVAVLLMSVGAGLLYFTVGAYWSSTVHLSKAHAGTLSGLMNTGANVGGAISPSLTPWLADHVGWTGALLVAAGIAALGGLLWWWIDPAQGLPYEHTHTSNGLRKQEALG